MDGFSLTSATTSVLILLLCFRQHETALCPTSVELTVSLKENGTYNQLPVNPSYSILGGNEFQIRCRSRSPVEIIAFQGLLPNPPVTTETARLTDNSSASCHEVTINLLSNDSATGKYICQGASVYVYANGNNPPYLLNGERFRTRNLDGYISGKRAVLPCFTTNPSVPIYLYKDGKDLTNLAGITYDPMEGFSFETSVLGDDIYNGNYVCSARKADTNYTYSLSVKLSPQITSDLLSNITFDIHNDEIKCTGASSMTYFKCGSPIECEFMKSCKNRPTTKSCSKVSGSDCSYENLCLSIRKAPNFLGGLIYCSDNSPHPKEFPFFTDFNNRPVTDLANVSLDQYKFMDFIPLPYNSWDDVHEFFEDEKLVVHCNASKLLFERGLKWEFELADGTVKPATVLDEKRETGEIAYSLTSTLKFDNTKIRKLICRAPKINSNEWHTLYKNISVNASSTPQLRPEFNETVVFNNGQTTIRINCSASGIPTPTITWRKVGQDYDPVLVARLELDGNTTTSFIDRSITDVGVYKCNATNFRNTALKYITLRAGNLSAKPPVSPGWIAVIVALVIILILTFSALGFMWFRTSRYEPKKLSQTIIDGFFKGLPDPSKSDCENIDETNLISDEGQYVCLPYCRDNEIKNPDKNLKLEKEIGRGSFGIVHKATLTLSGEDSKDCIVAVKTLPEDASDETIEEFLKELKIWQNMGNHENVVRFIGAVTSHLERRHAQIVVEYCSFNDLKSYLPKQKSVFQDQFAPRRPSVWSQSVPIPANYTQIAQPVTTTDLINWSYQVACGMEYLMDRRVVHRDLAARNVLLDSNRVAKVTDFGLAREVLAKDYYLMLQAEGKRLPMRWLAPEAMTSAPKFSAESDIWAFGVTLWEIFTLGDLHPYPNIPDSEFLVRTLQHILAQGERLEKPAYSNDAMHDIMLSCWRLSGSDRPRFSDLKTSILAVQETLANDLIQAKMLNSVRSTSDYSLSDEENFNYEMYNEGYDDDSV